MDNRNGPVRAEAGPVRSEGLMYLHSFNPPVVHRDLKARNVLLSETFTAKLSDFGVSRVQSEDGTVTAGVGTSRWLAPDVINGHGAYTMQCDIYSFGVVLVEMETHALPFAMQPEGAESERLLLWQVASGELRPHVSPSCDPQLAALVDWCLEHDPMKRPNAIELSYALYQIIQSTPEATTSTNYRKDNDTDGGSSMGLPHNEMATQKYIFV